MSNGKLTAIQIKNASPKEKDYKLFDGGGLFLLVRKDGSKYWRQKYRFGGKEKQLAIGVYPDVQLKEARERHDNAKRQLRDNIDPSAAKQAQKRAQAESSANSFEAIGIEWYQKTQHEWSDNHKTKVEWMLTKNLYPWIGNRPILEITAPELLKTLRRIESRGALETAKRTKQVAGKVFRYAIATGRAERDPSQDLKDALAKPVKKHLAAVTDPKKVGTLLLALDGYEGTLPVKTALKLAPLLFVRPGELRHAEWSEIDLEAAEWVIPAHKMKTKAEHLVPLCKQAIEALLELHPLTGRSQYVFPSARSPRRPMSNNAVLAAMRRMGIDKDEMSGHGFRAMARTILDEKLKFRPDIIEHQLAHAVKDPNGRAYNRTSFIEERTEMMQRWADYLDSLREQARHGNVIAGNFGTA
ncbi:MAG: integrase arm-type DNA-binding domain-containing protein [Porticoccaceae bacterium]|nr:integrase arm-type DNA-binding domain-containing protein [Pseudomonadales bacterium]MCP5170837.1 integrase arm-type DNA-binding domain-containing protein [Pseudomonadales bacterium]MCP5301923.1 integrase arm-type DNA-binding domain-containing protein [Pseudomonadales bacterium]